MNGIWVGKDSVVAIAGETRITFLRLKKDLIASILYHAKSGVIGVTYGHGDGWDCHEYTATIFRNAQGELIKNNDEATDFINLHSNDTLAYDEQNNKLLYTTYDNRIFEHHLAETIEMSDLERKNEIDDSLSVVEKMARWGMGVYTEVGTKGVRAGIDTRKYSIFYAIDFSEEAKRYGDDEFIYCRVGQNGYCDKGRAMLPTIEIRQKLTRMIDDNLSSIQDYKPNEEWFVTDSCSFPADGGWYWAIKRVTDDVIYLQGCNGDVYEVHRK